MKRLTYFIALGADKELMNSTVKQVSTSSVGILCSYPYHRTHNLNDYDFASTNLFADCGAFSTDVHPRTFTDFGIEGLAKYINENPFTVAAELDHWYSSFPVRAKFAGLLAKLLRSQVTNTSCAIARPIHGENSIERMQYLDIVDAVSGFRRDFYAIGGITKKEKQEPIIETLKALSARGAKRVHLFGVSDNENFHMAVEALNTTQLEQISLDSSSSEKSATHGTVKLFIKNPIPKLWDGHYTIKGKSSPDHDFLDLLQACTCPACSNLIFKSKDGFDESIHELGMQMIQESESAKKMFVLKAQIHNSYQFRLLVEELQNSIKLQKSV